MVERVEAREPLGPQDALRLARAASKVVVSRGRSVIEFDMSKDPPSDEVLLAHLLGRTGQLRAPAIKAGKTLLVGFNEQAYMGALK